MRARGVLLAEHGRESRIGLVEHDLRAGLRLVAGRGPQPQAVVVVLPHRDGVMTQGACEHRGGCGKIVLRIAAERREPRQLVENDGLLTVVDGVLQLARRRVRDREILSEQDERIQLHLSVA